ncbi:MAG: 3-deoxy-D-manno-octulosonic acid transferase, partial [Myxococcaceae bacterium]
MRLLYVLASYVAFALLWPLLALHRKTRNGWWERLGFYRPGALPEGGGPRIWLHGASAGDLLALSPMIGQLRQRFPDCKVFLSTMTNSGYMMASERLASQVDAVVYAPYDLWGATRRAVKALAPDLLVLEYTEIWPNLIAAARAAGARIVLTNGRFSPNHLSKYRTLFSLVGNPLKKVDLFLMREDDEAERALDLGAALERVWVTGNTKFDALVTAGPSASGEGLRRSLGIPLEARIWIAGSTHEGEEEKILDVYQKLWAEHADLYLVIAPRYIERTPRIAAMVESLGLSVGFRSSGNAVGARIVILDTIGELARAYALATVVFVGGSFTRRGGQNILEPAAQGRPVLFGPHMENFHDSVQVLVGRGGIQVNDAAHLRRVLGELLARPETMTNLGELAQAAVRQVSGASSRNVDHME